MNLPGVRTVRGGWQRTPLRVKLVAAVLMLVMVALLLISVANVTSLNSYLLDRTDEDLRSRLSNPSILIQDGDVASGAPSDYLVVVSTSAVTRLFDDGSFKSSEKPTLDYGILSGHLDGEPFTITGNDGRTRWRMVATTANVQGDQEGVVALGVSLTEADNTVARLIWIDLLVGAGVLAAVAAIGVAVVRASLHPLREMETTAAAIAAGDLSRRVPQHDGRTEVGQLGAALNTMLSQIERAFAASEASEMQALRSEERMRRFVADASHELRTPLTTVRGFAELYRQRGSESPPDEVARLMRRIEDEAKRMGLLVEDLLLLARMDRERPISSEPVDLLSIAADAVSGARITNPERSIELNVGKGPLMVLGDELRLRQVLRNLLDNAVAHTPPETPVEIRVRAEVPYAYLEVADSGPGMTAEQAERVFERFYRADPARGRKVGGTGLGLAIVAALVKAHNGQVTVDTEVGVGTVFKVRLDLDPAVLDELDDEDSSEIQALTANSQDGSSDT